MNTSWAISSKSLGGTSEGSAGKIGPSLPALTLRTDPGGAALTTENNEPIEAE